MKEEKGKKMISTPEYSGPDRRIEQRRKAIDRRDMIRFEPEKNPRRSGSDRRKVGKDEWDRRDI
jgi:hypothetical protein